MSPLSRRAACVSLWLLCVARPIHASSVEVWLAPTGGLSTYRMSEINDEISFLNTIYRPGSRLDEISSGASLGARLGVGVGARWVVALVYERLWARSKGVSSEYDLPANVFATTACCKFLRRAPGSAGIDLGIGVVTAANGKLGPHQTLDLEGQGMVLEGALALDSASWHRFGIQMRAGYHHARIDDVEADGASTHLDVDYSGLILRAGLRITIR